MLMVSARTLRRWLLALAASLAAALTGAAAQDRGEPGRFDYYVLSLSWSPSFCESAAGARSEQCGPRAFSFVVHGLWPQYEHGYPEACRVPSPRLDHRIVNAMLDLMPARKLVYHEWDAHGTCSGLDQRAYFDLVRRARAAIRIPPQFDQPQQALQLKPAELVDAFVKANPGLAADDISLDCNRSRLRELRICLTRDLKFRSCGAGQGRSCRADTLVLPPVRGR
jgi:ribonuclease T2